MDYTSKPIALLQLIRFDRPIGTLLLLWPTLWALWIAAEGVPDLDLLAIFIAGTFLTRSAGFVGRGGESGAPFAPMRVDDSLVRLLGSGLLGLTATRERIVAAETYERRRLASITAPGALVDGLQLTL